MVDAASGEQQKKRVLITRPIEDAILTQSLFQQYDVECDICSFTQVVHHAIDVDVTQYAALIFTSRNAVRAFCIGSSDRNIAVYCVGDATANLCRENGFKDVQRASGTVQDLENLLVTKQFAQPILYLRGVDITRPIRHPDIRENIAYHTDKIEEIDSEAWSSVTLETYDFIVFYSRRTADAFVEFMTDKQGRDYVNNTKALCLAPSMLKSLSVLPWQEILVASAPNQQSLVKKIIS